MDRSLFIVPLLALAAVGGGCVSKADVSASAGSYADELVRSTLKDIVTSSTPADPGALGTVGQAVETISGLKNPPPDFIKEIGVYPNGEITVSLVGTTGPEPTATVILQTDDAPQAVQDWYLPHLEALGWIKDSQFGVGTITTLNYHRPGEKLLLTMMVMQNGKTNVTLLQTITQK